MQHQKKGISMKKLTNVIPIAFYSVQLKDLYNNSVRNLYKGLRSKEQLTTVENIIASVAPFACLQGSDKTPALREQLREPISAKVFLGSVYKAVKKLHDAGQPFVIAVLQDAQVITIITHEDIAF